MRWSYYPLLFVCLAMIGCRQSAPPPAMTPPGPAGTAQPASAETGKLTPEPAAAPQAKTITTIEKPAGVTFKTLPITLLDDDDKALPFTIEVPEGVEYKRSFYAWTGELTGKDFSLKIDGSKDADGLAAQRKYLAELPENLRDGKSIVLETDRAMYFELSLLQKLYLQIFVVEVPFEGRTLVLKPNTLPTEHLSREGVLTAIYSASTLKPAPAAP